MGNSLFKLTSLNLNGIRSAASKGVEAWLAKTRPDCICLQEVKAQAADVQGRFDELAGLKGYFHFAEKKGLFGRGRVRPARCRATWWWASARRNSTPRAATWSCASTRPRRKLSIISCYFPSGSSGEVRQQAKFRFLDEFEPHLARLGREREFHSVRRRQHRPPGTGPEELAQQPQEQRLPARGAGLDDKAVRRNRPGRRLPPAASPTPPRSATRGGATAARPMPTTWAGGWTTTWPRRRWRHWLARKRSTRRKSSRTTRPSRWSTRSRSENPAPAHGLTVRGLGQNRRMDFVNLPLFAAAGLVFASVLVGLFSARIGLSSLLVFLLAGILVGEDGIGGLRFDDFHLSFWVGNLALAIILLDGGLRTAFATFRTGLRPAALLATVGVVVSAGITGLAARWLLALDWGHAMLLGAIVGSTDAAAVFALLTRSGVTLNERVAATLEIESGVNDPMAVYLTLGFIALVVVERSGIRHGLAVDSGIRSAVRLGHGPGAGQRFCHGAAGGAAGPAGCGRRHSRPAARRRRAGGFRGHGPARRFRFPGGLPVRPDRGEPRRHDGRAGTGGDGRLRLAGAGGHVPAARPGGHPVACSCPPSGLPSVSPSS